MGDRRSPPTPGECLRLERNSERALAAILRGRNRSVRSAPTLPGGRAVAASPQTGEPPEGNERGEDREMCSAISGRCARANVEPAVLAGPLYLDRTASPPRAQDGR